MRWGRQRVRKVFNAHYIAHHSYLGALGCLAYVALQPWLGLLPERRTGHSPDYRHHLDVAMMRSVAPNFHPGTGISLATMSTQIPDLVV